MVDEPGRDDARRLGRVLRLTLTLTLTLALTLTIEVCSASLRSSVFVGQGAGRYPTANSCVSDILDIAQGSSAVLPFPKQAADLQFFSSYASST